MAKIEMVSILIGEHEVIEKGKKRKRKIVSRVKKSVADFLGVKGEPGGIPVEVSVTKGKSAGTKHTIYLLGSRGRGYKLGYIEKLPQLGPRAAGATGGLKGTLAQKSITIPVPTGTPLQVIADFAQTKVKGKGKPQSIITPTGGRYYLQSNTSNPAGKK
jgi:hypothetical protein